ncbi:MAG: hypothetical protein ACREN8_03150 [Candidatus Dormibacteraceae bacterium]
MISERVQILLTPEQRERLQEESLLKRRSVASLVREAIEARFGVVSREKRIAAANAITSMKGTPSYTPEELNRLVESEREEMLGSLIPTRAE